MVKFKTTFSFGLCLEVRHHNIRQNLTKVLHLGSLLRLVFLSMQFKEILLQFTHLCKGLDDCECNGPCPLSLQHSCQHVKSLLRKHLGGFAVAGRYI